MKDHLIVGGLVVDGSGGPGRIGDVRLRDGAIAEIGTDLRRDGCTITDATGRVVAPGLVDLHVHVYTGVGAFSICPADAGLRHGVTAMLDTGTAGALTFEGFRYVMREAPEDVFALLNISLIGCVARHDQPPFVSDLTDGRFCDVGAAVECVRRNPDRILGMKARLTDAIGDFKAENERAGLYGALEAARLTGLPCMIHHVRSLIPVGEALGALRAGDIYTHAYNAQVNRPFAEGSAAPLEAARAARERGVVFDVGHGMGSFAWSVAEPACVEHGFWPDTISTDVHRFNLHGPVHDLPTTMSKLLHLGMPLERVIRAATAAPARAMGVGDRFGLLAPGRAADVAILRLVEGDAPLEDVTGVVRIARRRLVAEDVFKGGKRWGFLSEGSGADGATPAARPGEAEASSTRAIGKK